MSGPLQVLAVGFGPEADFEGRVLAEVDRLEGRGIVRVLDMLVVAKGDDGTVDRLVIGDDEDYGALLAGVLPSVGSGPTEATVAGVEGFGPVDARVLADSLAPGTALAFVLVEHRWAEPLFEAIADSDGVLLAEGFLTPSTVLHVGAEMAAMDAAGDAIAEAQAAEADAILLALTAQADAAEVIATSQAIGNAAAATAVRTLITAGLLEQAAAHEAIETLITAGLIVTAADEVVTTALAKGAATVRAASITVAQAQVLRYLPTPMTFALIADKLGISRGAAKERAERLYNKLGVHNRTDAVDRARDLGLIN